MSKKKNVLFGTFIAAAAGYITGILTAPKSGKDTRSDIKEAVDHTVTEAERRLEHLHAQLLTHYEIVSARAKELKGSTKKETESVVAFAQDAKIKAEKVLEAIRSHEADDKDLDKAITEAEQAIEHVRKFLKK